MITMDQESLESRINTHKLLSSDGRNKVILGIIKIAPTIPSLIALACKSAVNPPEFFYGFNGAIYLVLSVAILGVALSGVHDFVGGMLDSAINQKAANDLELTLVQSQMNKTKS